MRRLAGPWMAKFWRRRDIVAALALLAGNHPSLAAGSIIDPAGPVAEAQNSHLWLVVSLTLLVIIPAIVLTPLVAWRYRHGHDKRAYRPKWDFSWPLEIIIWGIPVIIVTLLAWNLWVGTHQLDPYRPLSSANAPTHIQVVGYDWKWLFIYPDLGIASVGVLAFPADRPVSLELTTADNMQSFMVPALGGQIYAMPGMVTRLNLAANAPGRFTGENTQYTGRGFYEQKFIAEAMSPSDFAGFVAKARQSGLAFDARIEKALGERTTKKELASRLGLKVASLPLPNAPNSGKSPVFPIAFRDVPDNIFAAVVARYASGRMGSQRPARKENK